ncbi:AraC family transcriptional regulator [Corallococcus coralloides]|uniref:AraC family transcriptional regulator n=1 Tax=Corallococcus coralloides TaxID=184914 RepID=A0A410RMW4_CORCK|nr:AraC family transcriptional regulator [Corallococcus coralloides]QAT83307.1 AraC family transcriptional regulator [Corallococcus coralloides]
MPALPHAVVDGPFSIQTFLFPELPGLRLVRYRTDGRLLRSVKERFSVMVTQRGHSEWWGRGKVHSSSPRTVDLKQMGEVHRDLRRDGPARFQVIAFDESLVAGAREALGALASARLRQLQLETSQPAAAAFVRLHAVLDAGLEGRSSALALQTSLAEALSSLVGCLEPSGAVERRYRWPIRRVVEALHEAIPEGITLESLAQQVGWNRFHLCRAFREESGMPPHAYLTHLRVSRAQRLLSQGLAPAEVALQVGLCDQSQLNRHFKRIVGLTPGQFARAVQ